MPTIKNTFVALIALGAVAVTAAALGGCGCDSGAAADAELKDVPKVPEGLAPATEEMKQSGPPTIDMR